MKPPSTRAEIRAVAGEMDKGFSGLSTMVGGNLDVKGVDSEDRKVKGIDGNDIPISVFSPSGKAPTATVVYQHGGGMAILTYKSPHFVRFCKELAARGLRVILTGFRNSIGNGGKNTFPAGLNDCYSVAMWAADTFKTSVTLAGDSAGGNASIAVTLMAKQKGTISKIKNVYAIAPMVSGKYPDSVRGYKSQVEFGDGSYMVSTESLGWMAQLYTAEGDTDAENSPLAWVSNASVDDLKAFPPTVIVTNEFDPLKDEGIAFYNLLTKAGVKARSVILGGTTHTANVMFELVPDYVKATLVEITAFANGQL